MLDTSKKSLTVLMTSMFAGRFAEPPAGLSGFQGATAEGGGVLDILGWWARMIWATGKTFVCCPSPSPDEKAAHQTRMSRMAVSRPVCRLLKDGISNHLFGLVDVGTFDGARQL